MTGSTMQSKDVLLLVGTMKGAFFYRSDASRKKWTMGAAETVLRDSLATDSMESIGVYFGTRSGKLFGSSDSGDLWTAIADGLPPIVCVKTALIEA